MKLTNPINRVTLPLTCKYTDVTQMLSCRLFAVMCAIVLESSEVSPPKPRFCPDPNHVPLAFFGSPSRPFADGPSHDRMSLV